MPTKPVLPITELDFFRVKEQLKEFLRKDPQGRFQDIDFEGSNMSVLLDVLAYNTYQNNFYANMAITEMFLDSAQLENSVVSHAKELNYLPRSTTSATAVVRVTIRDPQSINESTFIIPENTRFTTSSANRRFNFYTNESYIARRDGDVFVADNVEIFEGELVEEITLYKRSLKTIRLVNQNIDTSSIRVFENFNNQFERIEYFRKNDIFGVQSDDAVFYIQPAFDGTYEIVFGNDRFGRNPNENSPIRITYRITNGVAPNGASRFSSIISRPGSTQISTAINATVTTIAAASGGADKESLEDTKFFAPRSIQVQERAVTERDYEILLKQRFNEIKDISVFGGDELDPPRYGKVAITVNLDGGLSDIAAKKYEEFLKDKTPVGIQPILLPPEFLFIDLNIDISFSSKQTRESKDSIEAEIRNVLKTYSSIKLNKFAASFELSRVSALIDSISPGIINNTIDAIPYILYSPGFGLSRNPTFSFGSSLVQTSRFSSNFGNMGRIQSSAFIYKGSDAVIEDDGKGNILVLDAKEKGLGNIEIIRRNAGTVNYENGVVKLSDFIIDSYFGNGVKIFASTRDKNVTAPKTRVLKLNDDDVAINIKEVINV